MGRVLPFNPDPHRETRELLSWLATGQLAPEERARVEAHLAVCADCREEFGAERKLLGAVGELPFASANGWAALRARIEETPRQAAYRPAPAVASAHRGFNFRKIGVFLGAQAALLAAAVSITLRTAAPVAAPYHALSSVPVAAAGNAVIVFRPDVRESDMRRLLNDADARLVDGPTAANAYVLRIPAAERDPALARLRRDRSVALAEPLDDAALR